MAVRVLLEVEGGRAGRHVVRVDVYEPKGKWASYYSRNVVTSGGVGELVIPFAEGDRAGVWRLELRDVVSGQRARVGLRVARREAGGRR